MAALPFSAGCHRSLPQELRQTPSSPASCHYSAAKRTQPPLSQRLEDSFMVITDQGAGGRSPSQAPLPFGGCLNQGTESEPHCPSREQLEGVGLEQGLAGAEGRALSPLHSSLASPSPHPPLASPLPLTCSHHPPPLTRRAHLPPGPQLPTPSELPLHLPEASLIAF